MFKLRSLDLFHNFIQFHKNEAVQINGILFN